MGRELTAGGKEDRPRAEDGMPFDFPLLLFGEFREIAAQ